jgi:hypothetical protein
LDPKSNSLSFRYWKDVVVVVVVVVVVAHAMMSVGISSDFPS